MHRVFSKCWSSSIDGVKLVNIDAAIERANSAFKAKKIMALQHSKFEDVDQAMASQGINSVKRSEEHTSELQSLMRISYAVFCLTKTTKHPTSSTYATIRKK